MNVYGTCLAPFHSCVSSLVWNSCFITMLTTIPIANWDRLSCVHYDIFFDTQFDFALRGLLENPVFSVDRS